MGLTNVDVVKLPSSNAIAAKLARSGSGPVVRPLAPADEALCRALSRETLGAQFAGLGLAEPMLTTLLDQQYHAQQVGYRATYPDAEWLVIEHCGAGVGRLIVSVEPARAADAAAPKLIDAMVPPGGRTLHLVDIAILASARGHGLGSAVIGALEAAARDLGATRLALAVARTNSDAQRLYQRLGFIAGDGEGHVAMVKQLQ
jgi:GNAT superfamily N-acetyltransferase